MTDSHVLIGEIWLYVVMGVALAAAVVLFGIAFYIGVTGRNKPGGIEFAASEPTEADQAHIDRRFTD